MIKKIKKHKTIITVAGTITIIGLIILILFDTLSSQNQTKQIETENYTLKYNKSWTVKKQKENSITLKQKSNAQIKIEIIKLNDQTKYSSIDELIDEINYNIEKQNKDYKLLSKKETTVTKYEYKAFKLLYENTKNQVMTTVYKKSDNLILINYEADSQYFDILLDSAQNIIYNFNPKEKTYTKAKKIKIATKNITYEKDSQLDKKINKTKTYEIADNNYYVKYSIPDIFILNEFNSKNNYFKLDDNSKDIVITTYIYKTNIYELLDKESKTGIYNNYKIYQDYEGYEEKLNVQQNSQNNYIYKNSYSSNNTKYENIDLIYTLNKNHTLIIEIKATNTKITEKLINNIKINKTKNYSSYITSKKQDNNLISTLKRYTDYSKEKIQTITIKIKDKYTEIQKYNNIYEERIYGLNYNEEKEIYDYEIKYKLTSPSATLENQIENINTSFSKNYGKYNNLTQTTDTIVKNKTFKTYIGGYTNLGGIPYTNINRFEYYINKKVLFYELTNGGYLIIEISANDKTINEKIINEVTNFEIKEK